MGTATPARPACACTGLKHRVPQDVWGAPHCVQRHCLAHPFPEKRWPPRTRLRETEAVPARWQSPLSMSTLRSVREQGWAGAGAFTPGPGFLSSRQSLCLAWMTHLGSSSLVRASPCPACPGTCMPSKQKPECLPVQHCHLLGSSPGFCRAGTQSALTLPGSSA